ncbi:DNA-binding HxlR family transcriptional regulator [Mucilaginibacter pocheonensis]|uniref:DNA-binding HxlR family transcriptional regulator n=1 Tax=Mucilaginibacter pocheonensis TaxID=398050 RepID=A0ABU1TCI5_9SPHI|nr:DNA-binding HxlR family transcriptional regulator [Mucilaginibacter pocheonensis]
MEIDHHLYAFRPYQKIWRNSCKDAILFQKSADRTVEELEADGLINRKKFNEIPPRVEYSLTDLGRSLKPILIDIATWGLENILDAKI